MGVLIEGLVKQSAGTLVNGPTPEHVTKYRKDIYPTGNDTFKPVGALGSASGDASEQDETKDATLDIPVESTFDSHVRNLVQQAGGQYVVPKSAMRVDTQLVRAAANVTANAAFLNKLVAKTLARKAKAGSASGAASGRGSGSGSVSGAVSSMGGSVHGYGSDSDSTADEAARELEYDEGEIIQAVRGNVDSALRMMKRR